MIFQLPIPKSPEIFERMICDLLNSTYSTTSFSLHGRRGQNQHGIDIISYEKNIYCQCKLRLSQPKTKNQKKIFLNELVNDANRILAKNNEVSKIIFATTLNNDTKLQDQISTLGFFSFVKGSFEFWSWDYICESIFLHQKVLNKYFPFREKKIELCESKF